MPATGAIAKAFIDPTAKKYTSEFPVIPSSYPDTYSSETNIVPPPSPSREEIKSFTSDITLNKDSSYVVQETIVYDFGTHEHHGIYRDIPYQYKRPEGNFNVRISIQNVQDENGTPYPYTLSHEGENLRVKIGDPKKTITGIHTYRITYSVLRGILYFKDHDELYWNVTGNEWTVPMQVVKSIVHLPAGAVSDTLQTACFTGSYGSTEKNCALKTDTSLATFTTTRPLGSGEGLTIVLGLPKGIFREPTWWQQILWFMQDNWVVFVPFIVFFILLYRWFQYGRDPETRKHIVPMYDAPKGMTPAEVGVLVDERADPTDLSGTLIQLAIKGYIKIKEVETKVLFLSSKDYEFIKLKEPDEMLQQYERTLLNGIFDDKNTKMLSDLKNKFYKTWEKMQKELYALVTQKGYFPTNPENVRSDYYGIGMTFIILGIMVGAFLESYTIIISLVISGILILIFSSFMPRKTVKGVETYTEILGFKLYLSRAEKKQIDFFNAPEKKPEVFEKFLPYAIVLGVETAWAKEFEDMYKNPPNWYEARDIHTFNSLSFINTLNSFTTTAASTMASTPSSAGSGGSGFSRGGSGGGFGGGGGGSW
jgi:uncharacterized membrane protein